MPLPIGDIVQKLQDLAPASCPNGGLPLLLLLHFLLLQGEAKLPFVQLQAQQRTPAAPLDERSSGQQGLEAEEEDALRLSLHQGAVAQPQVAPALEGEGSGRLAEGSGEAGLAGAGVSMLSLPEQGGADALVLALVAFAARQPALTVWAAIEGAAETPPQAVAGVAPNATLTPAAILTRVGVAPVDHLLAEGACGYRGGAQRVTRLDALLRSDFSVKHCAPVGRTVVTLSLSAALQSDSCDSGRMQLHSTRWRRVITWTRYIMTAVEQNVGQVPVPGLPYSQWPCMKVCPDFFC